MQINFIKLIWGTSNFKKAHSFSYSVPGGHTHVFFQMDPCTTYLGVELSGNLTWNRHIAKTFNKATKTLSFLRRNLRVPNVQAKSVAYKGLVRPTLEYRCSVWDPHHKNQNYQLEIIQRRAARFVLTRYHNTSSVTKAGHSVFRFLVPCQRLRAIV